MSPFHFELHEHLTLLAIGDIFRPAEDERGMAQGYAGLHQPSPYFPGCPKDQNPVLPLHRQRSYHSISDEGYGCEFKKKTPTKQ